MAQAHQLTRTQPAPGLKYPSASRILLAIEFGGRNNATNLAKRLRTGATETEFMTGSTQAEQTAHQRIDAGTLELIRRKPWTNHHAHLLVEYAQFSQHIPDGARVIEFGCGDGWLVGLLAKRGCHCAGVDINAEWLRMACHNWPRVNFVLGDWSKQTWFGGPFDVVIWNGALHHSLNVRDSLNVSWHNTKPGGLLLCCEPGLGHTLRPFTRAWHKQTGVTEKDTPPVKIIVNGLMVGWRKPEVYPAMNTLLRANGSAMASLAVCAGKWAHGFVKMWKPL